MARRRLNKKQPVEDASLRLVTVLPLISDSLGLFVFKVAPVSRRCLYSLENDGRVWSAVLRKGIRFCEVRQSDAAARALFRRLPADLARLAVTSCNIREATLQSMARQMPSRLRSLSLEIGASVLGKAFVEALVEKFHDNLDEFRLACNPSSDAAFRALVTKLPQRLKTCCLALRGAKLRRDTLRVLLKSLSTDLEHLELDLAHVLPRGFIQDFCGHLQSLQNLRTAYVDFSSMKLDTSCSNVDDIVRNLPRKIRLLRIEANGLKQASPSHNFANGLQSLSELRELCLSMQSSVLHRGILPGIARNLPWDRLQNLSLDLADCNVLDQDLICLGNALKTAVSLRSLHLGLQVLASGFEPGDMSRIDAGAVSIANGMPSGLKDLCLAFESSRISDAGALALAKNLPRGLESLCLQFAGCDEVTASTVEEFFKNLPLSVKLLDVHFSWTVFGWARRLQLPSSLQHLWIQAASHAWLPHHPPTSGKPEVPKHVMQALHAGLRQYRFLRTLVLDFEGCGFHSSEAQELVNSLPPCCADLSLNFGGLMKSSDSEELWEGVVNSAQARFGKRDIRIPKTVRRLS